VAVARLRCILCLRYALFAMDHPAGCVQTAGIIESNTRALPPHFEEQLFLKNRLIQPTSVVVANIADFGGDGAMHVAAVHVHASTQDVTFVMRNVHPTEPTTLPYRIAWAIFN
jgi:hypothetical protein